MTLPGGYSITTTAGLKTLWHDSHCITVVSAETGDDALWRIAEQHMRYQTPVAARGTADANTPASPRRKP